MSLRLGAEEIWIREGVGSIKIFYRKFSFSQCRKFSQVNPSVLCFRKISVLKKFMDKRGVEYQDFPSKTFCLTVPKNFVGKPFSVSLFSGAEEVWIREGEYQDFVSTFFCLTVPKIFVGKPFCAVFQKNFW